MPASIVGALAVELGLDTAKFEQSLKGLPGVAGTHLNSMSAEMKRTSREGAESFRIIDEALGIHVSRPITKIVTETFPGFAKGLQSLLGAGVVAGLGLAAFEAISAAVEKLQQKFEAAKKAQEEYEAASRHLDETLQDLAISHEKRLAQMNAELAALAGDKQGALAGQIHIASIEDAELAVQQIDKVAEAMERAAKAAEEANTTSHRFWDAFRKDNTSVHNLGIEDATKNFEDFKAKLKETSKEDAAKGTHEGMDLAIAKANELDARLKQMQSERVNDFVAFADDINKAFLAGSTRIGFTDKEIAQMKSQADEARQFVQTLKDQTKEHEAHVKLLNAQNKAQEEIGSKEIEKLKADTAAQLALAAATGESIAAQRLQNASGEATALISRILEEAHGRLTARIREEITTIHALTAERQFARDAIATNQDLQKAITAVDQQIESERRLAAAYRESGDAVLAANVEAKLQPQIEKAKELRDEYEKVKKAADDYAASIAKLAGAAGPPQGMKGISPEAIAVAKHSADEADARVEELRTKATTEARQKYQVEIEQNDKAIKGEGPLLANLAAAYLQNEEAVRRAQVALALYHWEQAHPGQTVDEAKATLSSAGATSEQRNAAQERLNQIAQVSAQLDQQSKDQQRLTDAEIASRYSLNFTYDEQISKLLRIKEIMQQYGHDTLLIDAEIQDANERFIHQWDEAALKVGKFGDKSRAIFNEMVIEGKHAGEEIARAFQQAIGDANTQLAKLLTGQKTDFKGVTTNLAEQVTKAKIQELEGGVLEHFGFGKLAESLKGKPDGTDSNPLHVIMKNAPPSVPFGQGAPQSQGFGIGSFLSSIGFRAQGGPVMPGNDYVVGENGPELLRIPHAGTILSNADMRSMSTINRGGDVRHSVVNQTFNGIKDADNINRTQKQQWAKILRHIR